LRDVEVIYADGVVLDPGLTGLGSFLFDLLKPEDIRSSRASIRIADVISFSKIVPRSRPAAGLLRSVLAIDGVGFAAQTLAGP
jgi:hypothetical protein